MANSQESPINQVLTVQTSVLLNTDCSHVHLDELSSHPSLESI